MNNTCPCFFNFQQVLYTTPYDFLGAHLTSHMETGIPNLNAGCQKVCGKQSPGRPGAFLALRVFYIRAYQVGPAIVFQSISPPLIVFGLDSNPPIFTNKNSRVRSWQLHLLRGPQVVETDMDVSKQEVCPIFFCPEMMVTK